MYLVHCTSEENLKSIKKTGFIYTSNEMVVNNIIPENGYTIFENEFMVYNGQYNGVYMSLMTNEFFDKKFMKICYGLYLIIFNIDLLFEDNKYHFNVYDSNGDISKSSYFPEDLDIILSLNLDFMNEVIFHHKIDINKSELIVYQNNINNISKELITNCHKEQRNSKRHLNKCKNIVRMDTFDIYDKYDINYQEFEINYKKFKELYMIEWNETIIKDCKCEGCINQD